MSKGKSGGSRPGGRNLPPMGGPGNMGNIMSQMQKLQEEMAKAESALAINPEVVSADDVAMLQDMVLAAVNEALEKSRTLEKERMGAITSGINLPPGLGF